MTAHFINKPASADEFPQHIHTTFPHCPVDLNNEVVSHAKCNRLKSKTSHRAITPCVDAFFVKTVRNHLRRRESESHVEFISRQDAAQMPPCLACRPRRCGILRQRCSCHRRQLGGTLGSQQRRGMLAHRVARSSVSSCLQLVPLR